MKIPEQLEEIIKHFSSFQGIGEKTATRFALSLLSWEKSRIANFAEAIQNILTVVKCPQCGFLATENECLLCEESKHRFAHQICIVESITDCMAIQKSHTYNGHFHILHGVLNPLMGIGPNELGIHNLIKRVLEQSYSEVILAINSTVEGDATCSYIRDQIPQQVKVERIGFGLPMGGSLEYVDALTITKAMENRKQF
ncbi:MAG: recombination protein RecR [Bdellovibrionales bacterium GWA2_49_15]|nr:MAG: recombination protein RecR [Bdellovibrionales bacterium GWA2_49_15]